MKTSTFSWRKIKTDAKMRFYTGINTIVLFNKIFLIYQKEPKHAKTFSNVKHQRCSIPKKLSQCDEFLLSLTRLRLGLLNEDSAERFEVNQHFALIYLQHGSNF